MKIIRTAADCSIKKFMDCAFSEKYKVLIIGKPKEGQEKPTEEQLKEIFTVIFTEYVDLSDLYQTRQFELNGYIADIGARVSYMTRYISLQRVFLQEFDLPYLPGLRMIEKYGYNFTWDPENTDKQAFLNFLERVEMMEKRFETELDDAVQNAIKLQEEINSGDEPKVTLLESRKKFIMQLNRMGQIVKMQINKETTSIEEFALMLKDIKEQQRENADKTQ